ncbi:hypothetical protein U1Q18_011271 [Sarracenia purpurea var. burkii]
MLVDVSLEGNIDVYEACKYLKIGLLSTQNMPKLRPSMYKVVKLLTGAMNVDEEKITKPGLISELMGLKSKKDKYPLSADSRKLGDSPSGVTSDICHHDFHINRGPNYLNLHKIRYDLLSFVSLVHCFIWLLIFMVCQK